RGGGKLIRGLELEHVLEFIVRVVPEVHVLGRFRAGDVLGHVRGGKIEVRGGEGRIELHGLLEVINRFRVLGVFLSRNAAIEIVARLEFIASRGAQDQHSERGGGKEVRDLHWPASICGVIKPTLSIPTPLAASITLATSWKSRSGSPLTKITR